MKYATYVKTERKNKFNPMKITFISKNYKEVEDVLCCILDSFDNKGYALLGDLCIDTCSEQMLDYYDFEDLQRYGWDKCNFDVDEFCVRKNAYGMYYVNLIAPIEMAP